MKDSRKRSLETHRNNDQSRKETKQERAARQLTEMAQKDGFYDLPLKEVKDG